MVVCSKFVKMEQYTLHATQGIEYYSALYSGGEFETKKVGTKKSKMIQIEHQETYLISKF